MAEARGSMRVRGVAAKHVVIVNVVMISGKGDVRMRGGRLELGHRLRRCWFDSEPGRIVQEKKRGIKTVDQPGSRPREVLGDRRVSDWLTTSCAGAMGMGMGVDDDWIAI